MQSWKISHHVPITGDRQLELVNVSGLMKGAGDSNPSGSPSEIMWWLLSLSISVRHVLSEVPLFHFGTGETRLPPEPVDFTDGGRANGDTEGDGRFPRRPAAACHATESSAINVRLTAMHFGNAMINRVRRNLQNFVTKKSDVFAYHLSALWGALFRETVCMPQLVFDSCNLNQNSLLLKHFTIYLNIASVFNIALSSGQNVIVIKFICLSKFILFLHLIYPCMFSVTFLINFLNVGLAEEISRIWCQRWS